MAFTNWGLPTPIQNKGDSNLNTPVEIAPSEGRLEPHPSGLNVLKITITRANCLNSGQSEVFTGIARVASERGTIHFVALNAAKNRVLAWEGYPDEHSRKVQFFLGELSSFLVLT